jgi:hypothetical protein
MANGVGFRVYSAVALRAYGLAVCWLTAALISVWLCLRAALGAPARPWPCAALRVPELRHGSGGTPRRAVPGPSCLSRHPCLDTPSTAPTLGLRADWAGTPRAARKQSAGICGGGWIFPRGGLMRLPTPRAVDGLTPKWAAWCYGESSPVTHSRYPYEPQSDNR